jgi:hypothetical protein
MSDDDLERRVRTRAYHLWENDGRPGGRDQEYWHRALEEERAAAVPESIIAGAPPLAEVAEALSTEGPAPKGRGAKRAAGASGAGADQGGAKAAGKGAAPAARTRSKPARPGP